MLIGPKELVRSGYALYRANFKEFLKYSLAQYAPGLAAAIIAQMLQVTLAFSSSKVAFSLYFILSLALQLGSFLLSYWILGAFIRVISERFQGHEVKGFNQEMQSAKPMLLPALIASILVGLALLAGMLLFIVPAIIFGIWFSFYMQAAFIEGKGGKQALSESKKLVEGKWWAVLGRLVFVALAAGAIAVLVFTIPMAFSFFAQDSFVLRALFVILSFILTFIYTAISIPYIFSCHVILYLDLKKNTADSVAPPTPPENP